LVEFDDHSELGKKGREDKKAVFFINSLLFIFFFI